MIDHRGGTRCVAINVGRETLETSDILMKRVRHT